MKKKLLALVLVVVLALTSVIGGTMAYLTYTDDAVNVMTLGNVYIKQHEYERVLKADGTYEMVTSEKYGEGYKLQEFTQAKPLYPATGEITGWGTIVPFDQIEGASGSQAVFAGLNNVQDKFVLVENTGKTDAYVRTLIALEYGSNEKDIIGISTGDFWTWNAVGIVEIGGNNYYLFEAIYKGSSSRHVGGILPAGEYTYSSLNQIYLKNEATNEDVEALDGNNNGTYDILVLSQAVQTAGFENAQSALDTAFGKSSEKAAEWFTEEEIKVPVVVAAADELSEALAEGGSIVLGADIVLPEALTIAEGTTGTLDLNGKTLTINGGNDNAIVNEGTLVLTGNGTINTTGGSPMNKGTMTIESGITLVAESGIAMWNNGGTLTVNGATIEAKGASYAIYTGNANVGGTTELNNANVTGAFGAFNAVGTSKVTVNGGNYTAVGVSGKSSHIIYASSTAELTIEGGTFTHKGQGADGSVLYAAGSANVTVNGGTFTAEGSAYTLAAAGTSTVTINGGTFPSDTFLDWDGTVTDNR